LIKSKQVLFISLQFQIPSEGTFTVLVFNFLSAFQNRFNYVRMHHLPFLFSFYSLQFQIVLSTVTMHALETMFASISLQFQIVSNCIRVYALETLISFFLCSSTSFQIASECMKVQIYPEYRTEGFNYL